MGLESQVSLSLPSQSGTYKVVQLVTDGRPELLFSHGRDDRHTLILKRFLERKGLEYTLINDRDGDPVPGLQGERYKVYGAGKIEIDLEERSAYFYDYS